MAFPWCTITLEQLLTVVKPSVGHLKSFGCKVWAHVPDKRGKAFNAKERSGGLVRFLLNGKLLAILEDEWTVETTRHCFQ